MPPCPHHQGIVEVLDDHEARLREKTNQCILLIQKGDVMEERMKTVEAKVYSPLVVVAVIGLIGTCATVAGSVLSIILTATLKAHGLL